MPPKGGDSVNDILCGWGIAIIYGDLPFTVHVCTGLSTLEKNENCPRQIKKVGVFLIQILM